MRSENIKYLPAVDHLRAFAAMLILVYHGVGALTSKIVYSDGNPLDHWVFTSNPLYSVIIEGHTAVGLFMVLSGFIFTYGAFNREISYSSFIRNRFLRIFPLFIFLTVVGSYIYQGNYNFLSMLQSVFLFSSLPGSLNIGSFSAMFWSISVEFMFYLIFPFLLTIFQRHGTGKLLQILLIMIIFKIIAFLLGANIRDVSYWTIVGRLDQFILGMIAAKIFIKCDLNKIKWVFILASSFIAIVLMHFILNKLGGWPVVAFWKVFWPSIEGSVWSIFLISYVKLFRENKNFLQRALSKIGEMSFSIYLIHYIVLVIIRDHGWFFNFVNLSPLKNSLISSIIIIMPIVFIISVLTYNNIEKPFLQLRKRY
ncbi:O-acetyltransferase OatA [compost metagenome]